MNNDIKIHIFCCVNQRPSDNPKKSCGNQNSLALVDELKQTLKENGLFNVKVTKCLCLGKCNEGPAAIIYPEGKFIHYSNNKDIKQIVEYCLGKNDINNLLI